ncbi:MAG: peroxiredoxin [Methanosarcinales archaeon]|nr:peroxiredoxin [Methanosarcinales archaeon]
MLEVGNPAPDFCLPDGSGTDVCLSALRGKWTVLYFYPRDNTRGCAQEARDFSASLEELRALGAEVVGVSPDSPASHQRFREKHDLRVILASDPEHQVLESYGAWGLKKMYGKEHLGVIRSTFLIDPQGQIARIWRSVKVKGHAEAVLKALKELRG